jgi:hypothetical protein
VEVGNVKFKIQNLKCKVQRGKFKGESLKGKDGVNWGNGKDSS